MYSECAHTSGQAEPRGLASEQLKRRNVGGVPDLFGKQSAVSGRRILDHREQSFGFVAMSCRQRIVGALPASSGQGRPMPVPSKAEPSLCSP